MKEKQKNSPDATAGLIGSDQPIRRTAGNGIDIDYYERQAKRLRSQAIHAWLAELTWLRFFNSEKKSDE